MTASAIHPVALSWYWSTYLETLHRHASTSNAPSSPTDLLETPKPHYMLVTLTGPALVLDLDREEIVSSPCA